MGCVEAGSSFRTETTAGDVALARRLAEGRELPGWELAPVDEERHLLEGRLLGEAWMSMPR